MDDVVGQSESPAPRKRADARRNEEALLEAAAAAFVTSGVDVPVRNIAAKAGVGVGTIYRHFPTRSALVEAVYRNELARLQQRADELLAERPPAEAMRDWMDRFADYVATKRAVATGIDRDSAVYRACTRALYEAGGPLLERAQQAGLMRSDVDIDDVMRFTMAYTTVNFASAAQRDRMLEVAFDGLAATPRPV